MIQSTQRRVAWALIALMAVEVTFPTTVYALSSGPSQPEVQGFTPASADNMVNLFTGDMSYNIPLLDVEGYPVNLAYTAGANMDQEASWVGLGWNLNVGTVERNLRGLPDDFAGEPITRSMGLRPNRTFGLGYGVGLQLFGGDLVGLNVNISPSFNNYNGPQFETGTNLSLRSCTGTGPAATGSLGLTSSSNSGLKLQPQIGFDYSSGGTERRAKAGLNFGLSIDSRQGLTNYSFGATASVSSLKNRDGSSITNNGDKKGSSHGLGSKSVGASFDVGHPTYSPQIGLPMENYSISAAFTIGAEVYGSHPNMNMSGFYSEQRLATNTLTRPAYGYLYLEGGQQNDVAMLDLNREKDGPYSGDRAGLPMAALTNDIFSVSGQGISGSYRPFRAEVGHVFDPKTSSTGVGTSLSGEVGGGVAVHGGGSIIVNSSNSTSSVWGSGNQARSRLRFKGNVNDPLYERVFFREANEATVEQDPAVWNAMQQSNAMRFTMSAVGEFDLGLGTSITRDGGTDYALPLTNYRTKREPRAQLFSYLTHGEAATLALNTPPSHNGITVPSYHMSEVTVQGTDGTRYVYGIPAYNTFQKDVEFNVGSASVGADGTVGYTTTSNSQDNEMGRDHFYSSSITPPYAYAFLLTAQVSQDYADIDNTRGPSDGDIGTYTKFLYDRKYEHFGWRTPATGNSPDKARHSEGLAGTNLDDKGTYVYGTKEVYYLDAIETRNFKAVFTTTARNDARGLDEDGTNNSQQLERLQKIELFSKTDLSTPIKTVHFEYDYSLCPGVPNGSSPSQGKLTLKKIWFTYGSSNMGVTAPYKFDYGTTAADNPNYDALAQDRWGSVKPNTLSGFWAAFTLSTAATTRNKDFPYAESDRTTANSLAGAWCLKKITLPTGGIIRVQYGSDDYAFVQNKQVMRMFKVHGNQDNGTDIDPGEEFLFRIPADQLPPGDLSDGTYRDWLAQELRKDIGLLYFRFKVRTDGIVESPGPQVPEYDYISGYCGISALSVSPDGNDAVGKITLTSVGIDDGASPVNPIARAAVEFFQVNYPNLVQSGAPDFQDSQDISQAFFYSMISSVAGFVDGIDDFFNGPNYATYTKPVHADRFRSYVPNESYFRLNVPDQRKMGGGHRVAAIRFSDEWSSMESAEQDESMEYGTDYAYGDENGSWGVASFEPLTGADENPFRQPIYSNVNRTLSPDDRFYQELPFGETLFPSPSVGYSKVVVKDHFPSSDAQTVHGTGKTVHEFYTAKDFPTITDRTTLDPQRRKNQWNILSLLKLKVIDHMHATQGYVVETNDMHGKPKRTSVYPEGAEDPISYEEYTYLSEAMGNARRLVNDCTVIDPQGNTSTAEIGLQYEFTADMREFVNKATSGGAEVNVETFTILVAPVVIPIILPKYSSSSTRFKSAVLTKKIHRFGQLAKVTRMSNGSTVTTENLAYDAITGSVLVTKVQNGFEDPIYNASFPAYWHYANMGPAYMNTGARFADLNFSTGGWANVMNAQRYFTPGDELALIQNGSNPTRVWVDDVTPGTVRVVDMEGDPITGLGAVKVLRSGRRNMQAVNMMELTLQEDPLVGMVGSAYGRVLDSKVRVFNDEWATECECLEVNGQPVRRNDWVLGQKGQWRLNKEMVWLTDRTRSNYDDNTNIRKDGNYVTFAPYYQLQNDQWVVAESGWTPAREVTMYNHRGAELENKDALGLYSAVTFGHSAMLSTAVGKNARYREIGFESFEELPGFACDERHFRFDVQANQYTVNGDAHTGRKSIRVQAASPVVMNIGTYDCAVAGCALEVDLKEEPANSAFDYMITVSNAIAPIWMNYDQLSGAPITVGPASGGYGVNATSAWSASFTIMDGNGCASTVVLQP